MVELTQVRESVRAQYAAAAKAVGEESSCGCGDGAGSGCCGETLYSADEAEGATEAAVKASLGCGVPTAVADLREGETVLDLGSGGGADILISARRVGPTGKAIGLDMTAEMLGLARTNAAAAGVANVEFVKGYIEEIPLADESVDVVISNCVINLSADKRRVIAEAARVLRPGGRFAVSDIVADEDMDADTRADMAAWTGCIAGALTTREFEGFLREAGMTDIEIRETHRVHEHAASAIIRARKPDAGSPALVCALSAQDLEAREGWLVGLRDQMVSSQPSAEGFTARFAASPGLEEELRALVAAEAECCPSLTLDLRATGRFLELEVAGPPEAKPLIEAMLEAP